MTTQRWAAYYAGDNQQYASTVWGIGPSYQAALSAAYTYSKTCPLKAEIRRALKAAPLADCPCTGTLLISVDGHGTCLAERQGELHESVCTR